MKKARCIHIVSTTMITVLFAVFTMMNSGCSTEEPILTESALDTESPLDTELAPDSGLDADVVPITDMGPGAVEVVVGETFGFALDSNPTTGYSWQPRFDPEFLELVDSRFVPGDPEMLGASGVEVFGQILDQRPG